MTEPVERDPRGSPPGDRAPAGSTRLVRPPSERYASFPGPPPRPGRARSAARGLALALGVAVAGAGAIVLLVAVLAVQTGLLIIAFLVGRLVGPALRSGGGDTIAPGRRRLVATALAIGGVGAGLVGTWLYSLGEGGTLGPIDYLGSTLGLLVPAQFVIAGVTAWWTTR